MSERKEMEKSADKLYQDYFSLIDKMKLVLAVPNKQTIKEGWMAVDEFDSVLCPWKIKLGTKFENGVSEIQEFILNGKKNYSINQISKERFSKINGSGFMRGNSEILDEDPKVVISLLKAKKENTGDILRMNLLIELNELNVQLGKRIETLVNFLVDCEERGGIGAINDPEIKEKFLQLHTVLEKILNFKKEIEDQIWNVLKYIKSRKIKELNSVFVEEAFILDERGKRVPYYPELNPLIKIAKSESLSWLPKEEY